MGAGLAVGGGAAGLSVSAGVNQSRGHENGSSLTHTETTADAGRTLTLNSGRDALLQGAQVSGESIKADIGRNLLIASEQDRDRYDMKQTGSSVGGSVIFGAGIGGSASLSGSRDKMNSDFTSVKEQSGLFAGKGGFDISVGNHTQLDGGVIASTAEKEKNRLDTGTLGWSDIHNQADYKTEHQGAGISTGGSVGEQFVGNMANNTLVGANGSGHDSSTTHAAVEDGTIIIRDKDKQQQDIATLDRDTEHAANGLSPIFDKEKEQRRLQEAQVIGEIGSQVGDIARTQGEIAAQKVAGSKMEHATKADRDKAQRDWENANPGKTATDKDISGQLYQNFYNQAFTETGLGTGGKVQQAIQAATAAIQGLAGGDMGQLLSGAAAPYLAEQIHKLAPDEASRAMAHAVVGAIVSYEAGNSAAAGAAGAVSGELMAQLVMNQLYPGKQVSELSETEKQTVSVLGTLAAGLAGGVTGGSAADGMAGAQAGKNSSDNNAIGCFGSSDPLCVGKKDLVTTGGGGLGPVGAGGVGAAGALATGGDDDKESQPNVGKDVAGSDKDKAELGGAGSGTPGGWGPEDEENSRKNESVKQQQKNHFDELRKLYDKNNPTQDLNIDGQTIRQGEVSNSYGTTKVFESQSLTDQQIQKYAQQLAGDTPLKEVRSGIYTANLSDGSLITLRNVSTSEAKTGARWTVDIRNSQRLNELGNKYSRVEIKFK